MRPLDLRFALAWTLPLGIAAAAWFSPWAAWGALLAYQGSPPAAPRSNAWFIACLRLHVVWQAALLAPLRTNSGTRSRASIARSPGR